MGDRELPNLAQALFTAQHNNASAQLLAALPLRRINLWLGPTEQRLSNNLHWDAHDSLFYQLQCAKEFLLFPPGDKAKLPYPSKDSQETALQWHFNITAGHVDWHLEKLIGACRMQRLSLISPNQTLNAFLCCKRCCRPRSAPSVRVMLFFLPAHWHHQVRSFSGRGTGDRCKCVN